MSEVIVITSGKGGVGKTTTTANVGTGLAQLNKKVVLIDTDIGLRNLDVVMGLENRIVYNLVDVVEGNCKIKQALIKDKKYPELYLLPSAQTRDKSAVNPEQMIKLIDDLRDDLHALLDLSGVFFLQLLQTRQLLGHLVDLRLGRLGFVLLALLHQAADLLGEHLALIAQAVGLLHGLAVLAIQLDHLVHEGELAVLKLFPDVFAHDVRRLADQIDINHDSSSFLPCGDSSPEIARQNKRSAPSAWDEVLRVATQIAIFMASLDG